MRRKYFYEVLLQNSDNIISIYDVVAFCYQYITTNIDNQILFIGEYIEHNDNNQNNPNLELLANFADRIKKHIANYHGMCSLRYMDSVFLEIVKSTEDLLQKYGKHKYNHATICYFLIQGIDLFLQQYSVITRESGPLNKYCIDKYMVFLNARGHFSEDMEVEKEYPDVIKANDIRSDFSRIIIVERKELPEKCKTIRMVPLQMDVNEIANSRRIKMALIPVSGCELVNFDLSKGSTFIVEYDENKILQIGNKIIELLNTAIDNGANIIVFPEYVCEERIRKIISDELKEKYYKDDTKSKNLLLVVAGSGWSEDSNNVSYIFNRKGDLIGRKYKYSAFHKTMENKQLLERLNNPGEEITLISMDKLGIAQIEICRDISDEEVSKKTAKLFGTQFLIVPAWSASIDIAFVEQLNSIISSTHRTVAIVCNACDAISDCKKKKLGVVMVPQKGKSSISGRKEYINIDKRCMNCKKANCVYFCDIDILNHGETDVNISIEKAYLK